MYQRHLTGHYGEQLAQRYLREQHHTIVARNVFYRSTEIDLITAHEQTIYFFEVKTRQSWQYGRPEEAVTKAKWRKFYRGALYWLSQHSLAYSSAQLGIISITLQPKPVIEVILDHTSLPFNWMDRIWR